MPRAHPRHRDTLTRERIAVLRRPSQRCLVTMLDRLPLQPTISFTGAMLTVTEGES
jgi:hypothetical protein